MARYFFHVQNGSDFPDDTGTECPGPDAARALAVKTAGEMLKDLGGRFWNTGEWRMHVADETGQTVCRLRFSAERGS